jgi:type IV secretory pathway TraG/TraD family ATPase VirD4
MERAADGHDETAHTRPISSDTVRAIHQNARDAIYVGVGRGGWVWSGAQRSTLVLGPPRAGKTSSLVIPNILLASGAVVSTSTKPDVMVATADARRRDGWTFLYDPSGEIDCPRGVERVGWSPLTSASKWDAAVVTSDAMVRASRMGGAHVGESHWNERAGALLSTLLHAAAVADHSMRDVLRWIDRHDGAPALEILSTGHFEGSTATDLLTGIVATDSREQSGIWSTASGVLAAYRTDGAMESTRAPQMDLDSFCAGTNTLYICSSGRRQRQFAPLVVATLGEVRDAVYTRAQEGRQAAPTLLALDEVANIAPVPDLPAMVSEGGGQGLLVLACLQDLSQARGRWGAAADGFLSLFGTTVVLPGIADTKTLRDVSALAGEHEVASTSTTRTADRWGITRASASVGTTRTPRLPVDAVARGESDRALVLGPRNDVTEVRLTPAHECSPWREMLTPVPQRVSGRAETDRAREHSEGRAIGR